MFLSAATVALGAAKAAAAPAKITSVTLSTIRGDFHKFVAMNAYDNGPKGTSYENVLVRIMTDAGIEGVGVMGYTKPDAEFLKDIRSLLGADPEAVYEFRDGLIWGRAVGFADLLTKYKHLDGPLCDLIGKLRGVPCWKLFGESVKDRVEVYDGTLYFSDLWCSSGQDHFGHAVNDPRRLSQVRRDERVRQRTQGHQLPECARAHHD